MRNSVFLAANPFSLPQDQQGAPLDHLLIWLCGLFFFFPPQAVGTPKWARGNARPPRKHASYLRPLLLVGWSWWWSLGNSQPQESAQSRPPAPVARKPREELRILLPSFKASPGQALIQLLSGQRSSSSWTWAKTLIRVALTMRPLLGKCL